MPMPDRLTLAAACLFVAGLVLVLVSVLLGEGRAGIALFIPFFYGTGPMASLGVLCFFLGVVSLFLGAARGAADAGGPGDREFLAPPGGHEWRAAPGGQGEPAAADTDREPDSPQGPGEGAGRPRAGGVVLIGPVPVIFGSDIGISRSMFYLALALMAAFIVVMLALAVL